MKVYVKFNVNATRKNNAQFINQVAGRGAIKFVNSNKTNLRIPEKERRTT